LRISADWGEQLRRRQYVFQVISRRLVGPITVLYTEKIAIAEKIQREIHFEILLLEIFTKFETSLMTGIERTIIVHVYRLSQNEKK
jgi:hypothetical protein